MGFIAIIYSLFSGLIFSFGLPPKIFPGLEWVAFIPFLGILLFNFKKKRYYFYAGFLSGFAAMGKYLFWFFKAAPLTWLGISNDSLSYFLVGLIWFLMVIYFALWFGLFVLFIKQFEKRNLWGILLISLSWPVFEFLRTYFYSFYLPQIGEGSIIGNHMALGVFGYALADYPGLRQWSAVGGDYFLSFILVLINASIFCILSLFIRNRKLVIENIKLFIKRFGVEIMAAALIIVLALIIFTGNGERLSDKYFLPGGKINVAALQFDFPVSVWSAPWYSSSTISFISARFKNAVSQNHSPDLIVMPEGADLNDFTGGSDNLKQIKSVMGKKYQVVISGDFKLTDKNNAFLAVFDNNQGLIGTYAKQFLMPGGEYLPLVIKLPADFLYKYWSNDLSYRWFAPGRQPGVFQTQFGKIGVLACSEIISPELIKAEADRGAQIVAYSASDSIFRGSGELHAQNLAMAQIRAAETRRSVIYASNGEKSFIINPQGNIIWVAKNLDFENGYAEVPLNSAQTPYDRFGDWFIYLSGGFLMLWLATHLYCIIYNRKDVLRVRAKK